ncbi:MAG: DUF4255 domain-containing protein [Crocinitomicaceae bacterium]|nr:DUF4255 domain-containing protein [Crocinitomicaceae bacterium]
MIYEVMTLLMQQVEIYLDEAYEGLDIKLELGNVAALELTGGNEYAKTLVNLINYQEEGTLRNVPNYTEVNGISQLENPVVNLNLFVLFCSTKTTAYSESIKDISKIIEFFQGQRVFTPANTIYLSDSMDFVNLGNFKIYADLYTPSFEELNYIWGSLGGKQLPSVLYKFRIVQLERKAVIDQAGLITETNQNINNI